jgi:hypothetical protein
MKLFISILFWAGIVFLADGSLGLLLEEKWQKMARGLNIRRLALAEIGVALGLLALHYLLLRGQSGG